MAEQEKRQSGPQMSSSRDDNIEFIRGKTLLKLFNQLVEDKTVLRVSLLGKNYERLTIITELRERNGEYFLVVDYPSGFSYAAGETKPWKLRFEFTGPDRLPYVFRTTGGELVPEGLLLPMPSLVERRQRRNYFRLEPPLGTKLNLGPRGKEMKAIVYNISVGGALISCENLKERRPFLVRDQKLKSLTIIFPDSDGEGPIRVNIKEAVVKRVERDLVSHRYKYALQFTDISPKEAKLLQELIFKYQRKFLRRRHLLDD